MQCKIVLLEHVAYWTGNGAMYRDLMVILQKCFEMKNGFGKRFDGTDRHGVWVWKDVVELLTITAPQLLGNYSDQCFPVEFSSSLVINQSR
ncbi:hypothetical protein Sjap_020785 [Stephania japonica]|uniref:Uncharacterized protein n=1 Tax=Stephania japonica TaxID=461633 RepID=A0AAP0I0K1_9MAGN